ncbi:PLP-dependent cysteine synthase family protein [Thermogladius sp. 4427co]|uniref:PLP-dependent cysteine synthase family protein n=1 Tax=Thermogladius sp. 4427co TaxID=3450718 RepID=UPI003F7A0BB3
MGERIQLIELDSLKGRIVSIVEALPYIKDILSMWKSPGLRIRNDFRVEDDILYTALWSLYPRFVPLGEESVTLDQLDFYHNVKGDPIRVYDSILDLVTRNIPTPLVKFRSLSNGDIRVWGKLEWYHPFSMSIKDRVAWFILLNNESIKAKKKVIEATSTNFGLALAGLANYLGISTKIYLPMTAQRCIEYVFDLLGSQVVKTRNLLTTEIIDEVRRAAIEEGAVHPDQFNNDLNLIAHLRYTAKELDYQTLNKGLKITSIVSGLGTSGHLAALSIYFKSKYKNVRVYGVQPARGEFIPGLRRVETGMKWVDLAELDGIIDVTLEEAFQEIISIARNEGLLIGFSAGAIVRAVRELAIRGQLSGDVIIIVPDHGLKYAELIEALYSRVCRESIGTPLGD